MNHKHKDGYVSTLGEDTRSVGLKLPKVVDEALTKAAAADFETKSAWHAGSSSSACVPTGCCRR